jgi:hypothetical protein
MIIWRGRGILVAVIAFGCLLVTELFTRAYFHDETYYQQHGWPKLGGFLVAAGLVWLLLPRHETDILTSAESIPKQATGSIMKEQDQLFFISVRFWPPILCALGVVFYFVRD